MSDGQCKVRVPDCGSNFFDHQCSRKAVTDGYCTQHHPISVRARAKKSSERREEDRQKSPFARLRRSHNRIKSLEHYLSLMTSLCRLKYGNLEPDVYAAIEAAEALLNEEAI